MAGITLVLVALFTVVVILAFSDGCAPAILTPPTGPGTEYPCGVNGVVCVGADAKPTGMCCPETFVCGGPYPNIGCFSGECCANDSAPLDRKRTLKQRRARAAGESQ